MATKSLVKRGASAVGSGTKEALAKIALLESLLVHGVGNEVCGFGFYLWCVGQRF